MNEFYTIDGFHEARIKEKGSLFIAQAFAAESSLKAQQILDEVRKTFFDATHHCYAFRLFNTETRNTELKYSDAGEPSGTAGIRILNAIEHFELHNILVVVIRYFGGTKLGVGPLGKTYYLASEEVLKNIARIQKKLYRKLSIAFDASLTGQVHHVLGGFSCRIVDSRFEERSILDVLVEEGDRERLKTAMTELLHGRASFTENPEIYCL